MFSLLFCLSCLNITVIHLFLFIWVYCFEANENFNAMPSEVYEVMLLVNCENDRIINVYFNFYLDQRNFLPSILLFCLITCLCMIFRVEMLYRCVNRNSNYKFSVSLIISIYLALYILQENCPNCKKCCMQIQISFCSCISRLWNHSLKFPND